MFQAILKVVRPSPATKTWLTQVRSLSSMRVSSILADHGPVPTIDHLMSVNRAAQLMAEKHVDALPVTKNNKVVGLFTEHDYFEKVLNMKHQATGSAQVCDVATMGSELVVARPDDTVEGCIEVMMMKNLMALPVVQPSGQLMGTVSLMDLTKQVIAADGMASEAEQVVFSEPAHFPENVVLMDGAVVHDEDMVQPEALIPLQAVEQENAQPMAFDTIYLDGAAAFSENSVFPELTREEEALIEQIYGDIPPPQALFDDPKEKQIVTAQGQLLGEMDYFAEASDFPEAAPLDEVIHLRAAA